MPSGADFSGRFDEAWLAQSREEIIEPDLEIVDAHHHLWDHRGNRYLFPELMADLSSGHRIVATVFEECGSMYRADGPEELRSLGETEFVTGVAAMSASGGFGPAQRVRGDCPGMSICDSARASRKSSRRTLRLAADVFTRFDFRPHGMRMSGCTIPFRFVECSRIHRCRRDIDASRGSTSLSTLGFIIRS